MNVDTITTIAVTQAISSVVMFYTMRFFSKIHDGAGSKELKELKDRVEKLEKVKGVKIEKAKGVR